MQAKALAGNEGIMTFGAGCVFGNVAKQCARGWCDDLIGSDHCSFHIFVCVCVPLHAALLLSDQDLLTGHILGRQQELFMSEIINIFFHLLNKCFFFKGIVHPK